MALFFLLLAVDGRNSARGCTQCSCPSRQVLLGAGDALPVLLPGHCTLGFEGMVCQETGIEAYSPAPPNRECRAYSTNPSF